jgi:hypothetical protein
MKAAAVQRVVVSKHGYNITYKARLTHMAFFFILVDESHKEGQVRTENAAESGACRGGKAFEECPNRPNARPDSVKG